MNSTSIRRSFRSMHFRFHTLVLGVATLFGGLGCQPEQLVETEALDVVAEEMRVANSLTTRELVYNAISTNPKANDLVAGKGVLSEGLPGQGLADLFDPATGNAYLQLQLRDVAAQHFMEYLAGCALDETQALTWKEPISNTVRQWKGKAGLCTQWLGGVPTEECRRRVSACILARNNAFGRRVELSIRGEDPADITRFELEPQTRAVDYDPDLAQYVPSFQGCTTLQSGANRNCGWQPGHIGRCVPGQTVRLGAGGRAPDRCATGPALGSTTSGRSVLRVCAGIIGCDASNPRRLAQSEGTCSTTPPAVTFTCPASGDFNVMLAPYSSWLGSTASVGVETGTPAGTAYALSEGEVFRYREGAFYGTIFDSEELAAEVSVTKDGRIVGKDQHVDGSMYRKMFSCYAPEWSQGMAYALHRVCAQPGDSGADCAAKVTGACINPSMPSASMCGVEDGPLVSGDGDFEQCLDPEQNEWNEPVTVYLHAPCELLATQDASLCQWRSRGK
ncbi:hypothetical protein JRI60_03055 [Archangium violaceum]|uniref:hypothetical protein n=1 Tax=Archangium violaceum TaxID=83451 RepID=UPI00194E44A0|nr:hypothetical protein [Archangium violaceum]QRN98068.1 hypothetical protein JRI60_03055 [Archangium violaceum]